VDGESVSSRAHRRSGAALPFLMGRCHGGPDTSKLPLRLEFTKCSIVAWHISPASLAGFRQAFKVEVPVPLMWAQKVTAGNVELELRQKIIDYYWMSGYPTHFIAHIDPSS